MIDALFDIVITILPADNKISLCPNTMIICQGNGDFDFLRNSLTHKECGVGKQLSTRLIYQYYIDLDQIWETDKYY